MSLPSRSRSRRWRVAGYPRYAGHGGSCICATPENIKAHGGKLVRLPGCAYHAAAARNPRDHRIPWNCRTYWDGCNCVTRKLWVRKGKRGRTYSTARTGGVG